MIRRSLFLVPALLLAACQADAPEGNPETTLVTPPVEASALTVSSPFTTAAPAGGTGGVFLTLSGGPAPDTLTGARFEGAEQVEVHETYEADGGMRGMREVETGIPVPAGGTVELAPGGYHIMLINLTGASAEGDTLALTLDFAQAGPMEVAVPIVGIDQIRRPAAE